MLAYRYLFAQLVSRELRRKYKGSRLGVLWYLVNPLVLLGVYTLIGYSLLRNQLANHMTDHGWSVSGIALTIVFPTCGLMHAIYVAYAVSYRYDVDWTGLGIDWLAVPAAIYFVWVVRSLSLGRFRDWNRGTVGVQPNLVAA